MFKVKHYQYRTRDGRFDSLKFKFRRAVQFAKTVTLAALALLFAGTIGAVAFSSSTTAVEGQEIVIEKQVPVLDRIADCESGNGTKGSANHYRNGQVLMKPNTNGTVDVGKYQINTVWFKKATELGLDITKEEDNKKLAEWIYANRGTEDWYPSKSCWQR